MNPEKALEEALQKQRASLEKQLQSIRTHLQLAEKVEKLSLLSPLSVEQPSALPREFRQLEFNRSDCLALDSDRVSVLVSAAAQKQSLDPAILRAVMRQESDFRPCAVSAMGAQGLMQLMPATARELHVKDVFDPMQNVQAGAAYLKQMIERYQGDLRLALVGYNAGPGRADQTDGTPYALETQNYVASILADLETEQLETGTAKEDLAPPEPSEASPAPITKGATNSKIEISAPVSPAISIEKTQAARLKP